MSDSSYCCQKNIYCWARTETRTFTSTDTHMRSHIYTLTYPEVLITEHQRWKQNSVHVRGSRSFCSLQAVGFSVVAFIFSCCESKTVNRTGTKAEMETEEALHPLLQTSKACIHKTDQSPRRSTVICCCHFKSEMTALLLLWRESTSCWGGNMSQVPPSSILCC